MAEDKILTVNETAERLGVEPAHVRLLIRTGKLIGEKFGRDWMVRLSAVADFEKLPAPTTGRPRGAKAAKPTKKRQKKA